MLMLNQRIRKERKDRLYASIAQTVITNKKE